MHAPRVLKFLSLPAALGLGTALVLACTDGGPTAPGEQISAVEAPRPFNAPSKYHGGAVDNPVEGCESLGLWPKTVKPGTSADDNNDGIVCIKKATK